MWSKFFAKIYDSFMYLIEKKHLRSKRAKILSGLQGKVLEIGVGTGTNFEHYKKGVSLIGIEPSLYMLNYAQQKKAKSQCADCISLHNIGCGDDAIHDLIQPATLDAAICTLVLCTIPNPEKALINIYNWLKPGGKLLLLEHIRSHSHCTAKVQDIFNPLWKKVADGCQLNRPTDTLVAQIGFQLVREEKFRIVFPFYEAEYRKPSLDKA